MKISGSTHACFARYYCIQRLQVTPRPMSLAGHITQVSPVDYLKHMDQHIPGSPMQQIRFNHISCQSCLQEVARLTQLHSRSPRPLQVKAKVAIYMPLAKLQVFPSRSCIPAKKVVGSKLLAEICFNSDYRFPVHASSNRPGKPNRKNDKN